MVKCIDDNVGKILACLRDTDLIDRTIVVFTADHGDLRGEHHRQNKGVPYEGSARIPFVIRHPGTIRPGTVVHEAMACVDFKPTILSLTGVTATEDDSGRDCAALLRTGQAPPGWNDIVFMRGTGTEQGWVAAVTQRYKLVCSTRDAPWLFDLERDPDELTNCFGKPEYRPTVQMLARQLRDYGRTYGDPRVAHPSIQADLLRAIDVSVGEEKG
jgi:arylsulfatase A-like enzyme